MTGFFSVGNNFAGIIAFAVAGTINASRAQLSIALSIMCGLLSTHGGGFFIRDLSILHTLPTLFQNPLEFLFTVSICTVVATSYPHQGIRVFYENSASQIALSILDALGLAEFVVCGIDRAALFTTQFPVIVFCGLCTGVGGGLIASIFYSSSLQEILAKNLSYRVVALFLVCFYATHRGCYGAYECTVILSFLLCPFTNTTVQNKARTRIHAISKQKPIDFHICIETDQYIDYITAASNRSSLFEFLEQINSVYKTRLLHMLDTRYKLCCSNPYLVTGKMFGISAT